MDVGLLVEPRQLPLGICSGVPDPLLTRLIQTQIVAQKSQQFRTSYARPSRRIRIRTFFKCGHGLVHGALSQHDANSSGQMRLQLVQANPHAHLKRIIRRGAYARSRCATRSWFCRWRHTPRRHGRFAAYHWDESWPHSRDPRAKVLHAMPVAHRPLPALKSGP